MNRQTGKRWVRILLSGVLVLTSAAYAVWQHTVSAVLPRLPVQSIAVAPKKVATTVPKPTPAPTLPAPSPGLALTRVPVAEPKDTAAPPPVPPQETPPAQPIINNVPPPEPPKPVQTAEAHQPYADGEFDGGAVETAWGDVQVKVVVRDGVVTQVEPVTYPDHRRRSAEINSWAIPMLEQEVVTAQTASIDVVSQATVTSYGYQASLGAALTQARVALAQAKKP